MTPDANIARVVLGALYGPRRRPLALAGRPGSGKTTLLRETTRRAGRQTVWRSAFDLANELAEAIRCGRREDYAAALVEDRRPLCVEHLEDLREKPRTREEVRLLLKRAAARRSVLLTLTRRRGDAEVVRWLRSWSEIRSLD
jgi:chromosomal replication initiation ATPase DnaA